MADKRRPSRAVSDKRDDIRITSRGNDKPFVKKSFDSSRPPRFRTDGSNTKNNTDDIFDRIILKPSDVRAESSFDNLIGVDFVRRELIKSLVLPSKFPSAFNDFTRPPKHTMLYGPPGTGKTEIASAVANDIDATFYDVNKDVLAELGGGQAERQKGLKRLLAHARAQPGLVVIFMDEIDGIMGERGETAEFKPDRAFKDELIVQMDGIATNSDNVHIIGATNYPLRVDGAFISRVEAIEVAPPNSEARHEMLSKWLPKLDRAIDRNFDYSIIVDELEGYSGRGIGNVLRFANNLRWNAIVDGGFTDAEMLNEISTPEFNRPLTSDDVIEAIYTIDESINKTIADEITEFKDGNL